MRLARKHWLSGGWNFTTNAQYIAKSAGYSDFTLIPGADGSPKSRYEREFK